MTQIKVGDAVRSTKTILSYPMLASIPPHERVEIAPALLKIYEHEIPKGTLGKVLEISHTVGNESWMVYSYELYYVVEFIDVEYDNITQACTVDYIEKVGVI